MAQLSEQLISDHAALDRISKQLQAALGRSDLESAHTLLDLFWAKLAVHIRAEHLHLFPTVLSGLENAAVDHASSPSLDGAWTVVTELRQDHDFFMHKLARAVETVRQLLTASEQPVIKAGFDNITSTILEVEQKLVQHNEVEENQIYRWATIVLNSEEQERLLERVRKELRHRPSRFTANTWSNE